MRHQEPQTYIGITDFISSEQVKRIVRIPYDKVMDEKMDQLLGVGVMTSYKKMRGLPTKWADAFPPKEAFREIFTDHPDVYNVIHYADYEGVSKAEDYEQVLSYCGPNLDAIQFDMIWPDIQEIRKALRPYRRGEQKYRIILQVGRKALAACNDDIERVVDRLKLYKKADCIDYVLLDKSGGEGKEMDSELLRMYHDTIRQHFSWNDLKIVVAGGLYAGNLDRLLKPFKRDDSYLGLSTDAQGKLRPSGSALDPVDWDMAADYYEKAVQFFGWA